MGFLAMVFGLGLALGLSALALALGFLLAVPALGAILGDLTALGLASGFLTSSGLTVLGPAAMGAANSRGCSTSLLAVKPMDTVCVWLIQLRAYTRTGGERGMSTQGMTAHRVQIYDPLPPH